MAEYIEREALMGVLDDAKYAVPSNDFQRGVNASVEVLTKEVKYLPTADVVPKSEYDAVVSAVDNSTKEFLKLHDTYQKQNVEIEALKIANEKMYIANKAQEVKNEWLEKELDSKQFRCDSCDRIMLTGAEHRACVKQAKADVAREIFAEIESLLKRTCEKGYRGSISDLFAELKKKYTEGEPNGHV